MNDVVQLHIIFVYVQKADKRTLENHSLFDTKTNDINKMIKKILNNLAVKVSFYNSRYFNMYCKITSAKDKLAGNYSYYNNS